MVLKRININMRKNLQAAKSIPKVKAIFLLSNCRKQNPEIFYFNTWKQSRYFWQSKYCKHPIKKWLLVYEKVIKSKNSPPPPYTPAPTSPPLLPGNTKLYENDTIWFLSPEKNDGGFQKCWCSFEMISNLTTCDLWTGPLSTAVTGCHMIFQFNGDEGEHYRLFRSF